MHNIKKLIIIGFFVGMAYPSFGQKKTLTLSTHDKLILDQGAGVDGLIDSFQLAVGRRDTAAIKKMIHFPLRTAKVITRPCKHWIDGSYNTYDATKAGPIAEHEWPKYQKIFLSDQAVKWIPKIPMTNAQYGIDTADYIKPDPRCPVSRREVNFEIELQKLVDRRSKITVFAPYYPIKGHKKDLYRDIVFGYINGECKIIGYADKIGLPHSE